MKLTPASCRSAPIGSVLKDDEVRGLQLRVRPTVRTWHLYYRGRDGRQRRPALGSYPDMSLQSARHAARALLQRVAAGEDPSASWRAQRSAVTVSQLCDMYLQHCTGRVAATTLENYRGYVETRIRPAWGARKAYDISRQDVDRMLMDLERTAGPSEANHVRTQIRAIWNRGADTFGALPGDHVNPATRSYIAQELQRTRLAEPNEMAAIFAVLRAEQSRKPAHVAAVVTLFLTGCRVGEVENAQVRHWRGDRFEFDKHKTVRATGAVKVQYVHPVAAQMIDALPSARGKPTARLFGLIKLSGFWRRVRRKAGCPDLQLRDARRTFASYGITDSASLDQVSQLLGHETRQTTLRYAHLMTDKRKSIANDIAAKMLTHAGGASPLVAGRAAVVRLGRVRRRP